MLSYTLFATLWQLHWQQYIWKSVASSLLTTLSLYSPKRLLVYSAMQLQICCHFNDLFMQTCVFACIPKLVLDLFSNWSNVQACGEKFGERSLGQKCNPSCPTSGLVVECEGCGLKVGTCLTGALITNTRHLLLGYTNFCIGPAWSEESEGLGTRFCFFQAKSRGKAKN